MIIGFFQLSLLAACVLASSAHADNGAAESAALAAARRDARSIIDIAQRFENAEGVKRDLVKASQLYCQAARLGDAEGQFRLGWAYANGRGLPRDDAVAAALFQMANEQGHEYAAKLLQYVRPQPAPAMPACLQPEPPARDSGIDTAEESLFAIASKARPEIRAKVELLVRKLAPAYGIDPRLALAIISAESDFNPSAVSPKNASGLMQLIPETAQRFGVRRVMDPAENIKGGLAYLRWLLAFFRGNVPLAVAAYNAGERAIEKYRGIPPYTETRAYVKLVTGMYRRVEHSYDPEVVPPSPIVVRPNR